MGKYVRGMNKIKVSGCWDCIFLYTNHGESECFHPDAPDGPTNDMDLSKINDADEGMVPTWCPLTKSDVIISLDKDVKITDVMCNYVEE